MATMCQMSSGKWGYRLYHQPTTYKFPSRKLLSAVLKRENVLRFSEAVQKQYSAWLPFYKYLPYIERVTTTLQRKALSDCGVVAKDLDQALIALRNVRFDYKDDEKLLSLSVYGRYDTSREGLAIGTSIPTNIPLRTLKGKRTTLSKFACNTHKRPLVLIGMSLSK